jgi:hypothetical protein
LYQLVCYYRLNQDNNIHGELTNHHSFSDYSRKAENSNAKVNDNYNPDANDNVVDANNPSSGNSGSNNNTTPQAVILNFYDNDIGQFTNAKPILTMADLGYDEGSNHLYVKNGNR